MTWGFYGMLVLLLLRSSGTDNCRILEHPWKQRRCKSPNDHSRHPQRRTQFILLLPSPHRLHGLWRRQANSRKDHVVCQGAGSDTFRLRRHLRSRKLDNHTRQCRTAGLARHPAIGRYLDSLLCLDAQLVELHNEGSPREEAERQGYDVQEALVVHFGQHRCHLRLLLPQFIQLCGEK